MVAVAVGGEAVGGEAVAMIVIDSVVVLRCMMLNKLISVAVAMHSCQSLSELK